MKANKGYLPDKPIFNADELTSSEKLVLLAIKFRVGNKSDSYVGVSRLSQDTSLTPPTISKCIKSLESRGWLNVTRRNRATSIYSLPPDRFAWDKFSADTKPLNTTPESDLSGEDKTILDKVYNTKINNQEKNQDKTFCEGKPSQNKSDYHSTLGKPAPKTNIPTLKKLETIWKTSIETIYPDYEVLPFTAKEFAMLKNFNMRVGDNNSVIVIKTAVENWVGFTNYVKSACNHWIGPNTPSLEYFVKHAEQAYNFHITHTKIEKHSEKRRLEAQKLAEDKKVLELLQAEKAASEESIYNVYLDYLGDVSLLNFEPLYSGKRISKDEFKSWQLKFIKLSDSEQDQILHESEQLIIQAKAKLAANHDI